MCLLEGPKPGRPNWCLFGDETNTVVFFFRFFSIRTMGYFDLSVRKCFGVRYDSRVSKPIRTLRKTNRKAFRLQTTHNNRKPTIANASNTSPN